ncbi:MAG: AAA family ATPase [Acholeplasmatales bacterium]|nr:AAA family ATPase [Acholeplasmatales bacterium]
MTKKMKISIFSTAGIAILALIFTMIGVILRNQAMKYTESYTTSYIYVLIISFVFVTLILVAMGIIVLKFPEDLESTKIGKTRFPMLTMIDEEYKGYIDEGSNKCTLEEFCESFRGYAAVNLNLYYSIDDIRRFIASLAVSHILILQGMSGTGKTSLAYAFGRFLSNEALIVPVQPMWKERSDLIGYYNEFTRKFNETPFLEKMYEANYKNDIFITVLDEMNIARIEYYFAEFLSLLEIPNENGRYLDVISASDKTDPKKLKNGQIKLPKNMWFIGTANNDDSTFAVSDKVYDRAMVLNLDKKAESFDVDNNKKLRITANRFEALCNRAKKEYKLRFRNKHRISEFDLYLQKEFKFSFGNRIMKQINAYIPVFIACGGDEMDAIDDILSKKVIRKLESANGVYLKRKKDELLKTLDDIFGYNKMPICKAMIESMVKEL